MQSLEVTRNLYKQVFDTTTNAKIPQNSYVPNDNLWKFMVIAYKNVFST